MNNREKFDYLVIPLNSESGVLKAIELLRSVRVAEIWDSGFPSDSLSYRRLVEMAERTGTKFKAVDNSDSFRIGGVLVEIVNPQKGLYRGYGGRDAENNSIVMKLSYLGTRVLLCGYIEPQIERRLSRLHEKKIRCDVIKPSGYASSEVFMESARPRTVVTSKSAKKFSGVKSVSFKEKRIILVCSKKGYEIRCPTVIQLKP